MVARTAALLIGLQASLAFADSRVLKEPLFRGVIFPEVETSDGLGADATGIGDFNGDGIDDLALGATPVFFPGNTRPSSVYVVFGRTEFPGTLALASDPGTVKFFTDTHTFGTDVVAAGDVDGDGLGDVYVYQPIRTTINPITSRLYLIYGARELPPLVPVEEIGASVRGAVITGGLPTYNRDNPIASVGDVNGDGRPDLAIGESNSLGPLDERGALRILFGSVLTGSHELEDLLAAGLGVKVLGTPSSDRGNQGKGFARTVAPAGDVNGDGLMDLIFADPEYRNSQGLSVGRVHLIHGSRAWPSVLRAEELGSSGLTVTTDGEAFPGIEDVFGGGDLDGDGFAEFGFSIHLEDGPLGVSTLHVVKGAAGLPRNFLVSAIASGIPGFSITPEDRVQGHEFAGKVVVVPDEDGDGRPEIFAGPTSPGTPALVLRGGFPLTSTAITRPLHAFEAPANVGTASHVGRVVDTAGDVNADGIPDYTIGSANSFVDPNDSRKNIAFLVFGGFETGTLSLRGASPAQAPVGGSLPITISGTGFETGTRVLFGEMEAAGVEVDDAHTLRVNNPISAVGGAVDLAVVHPDSRRVVLPDGFRFNALREVRIETLDPVVFRLPPGTSTIRPEVLGDIDGDGLEDYVLREGERRENKSYLVYGGTAWSGLVEGLALAEKSVRFKETGDDAPFLHALGDLDGDGDQEYAVKSQYDVGGTGEFAILFEALLPGLEIEFVDLRDDPETAFFSSSRTFEDQMFNAGDFDGDGVDDLLASWLDGDEALLLIRGPFGRGERVEVDSDPRVIRIHDSRAIENTFANGIGPVGDFNGDGRSDIGIYSMRPDLAIVIVLGHAAGDFALLEVADLEASGNAFRFPALRDSPLTSLLDGAAPRRAGDLNSDGFADVLVKSFNSFDDSRGYVGILLGRRELEAGTTWTSEVTGAGGALIHGTEPYGLFGSDAVVAGDLDGTGLPDLLVGEQRLTEIRAGPQRGMAYIIHDVAGLRGESAINEVNRPVTAITGLTPADHFGTTVRVLGDQDGDSLPELLVEGSYLTIGGADTVGRTYLIKGSSLFGEQPFLRGDSNLDGLVNITDPIGVLAALFQGGSPLPCEDAADATDDGRLDISDPIRVLNFLFSAGARPPAPFPAPGADPTADGLTCRQGRRG